MLNINNKEWNQLNIEDILSFIKEDYSDESFFFEFKSDKESTKGIAKEICAFSNTYGGYLIIGINDNKEIEGCPNWTEEKINNVIYNLISPTPIFDIKRFITNDNRKIFVVRVEEGVDPPYISTSNGIIYQRISSSSCPVKDAATLNHFYNKKSNNMEKLQNIIGIDSIDLQFRPKNMYAVLDVGFSLVSKDKSVMTSTFFKANLKEIYSENKPSTSSFNVSRLGYSYVFSVGNITCDSIPNLQLSADLHNFIEIMCDGSVRYRILLTGKDNNNIVDIQNIMTLSELFSQIYLSIFRDVLSTQFIGAYKYQHLQVFKQFTPIYDIPSPVFKDYLSKHKKNYGENRIITSNRIPKIGYNLIDKQTFDIYEEEYNSENLVKMLLRSEYLLLGYIDVPI